MGLVLSAVQNAMSDSESVLSRAINAAFKVGVGVPAKWLFGAAMKDAGLLNVDGGGALPDPLEEEPALTSEAMAAGRDQHA
jgi:hypothetical protein